MSERKIADKNGFLFEDTVEDMFRNPHNYWDGDKIELLAREVKIMRRRDKTKGWLPFPKNTPSDKDWEKKFEVTRVSVEDGHAFVDIAIWYEESDWMGRGRRVIAFRPLPEPYQLPEDA